MTSVMGRYQGKIYLRFVMGFLSFFLFLCCRFFFFFLFRAWGFFNTRDGLWHMA